MVSKNTPQRKASSNANETYLGHDSQGDRQDRVSNRTAAQGRKAAVFSQAKSPLKSQSEESRIWPREPSFDSNTKMVLISEQGS